MLAKFTAFSLPDISQDLNSESEDAEQVLKKVKVDSLSALVKEISAAKITLEARATESLQSPLSATLTELDRVHKAGLTVSAVFTCLTCLRHKNLLAIKQDEEPSPAADADLIKNTKKTAFLLQHLFLTLDGASQHSLELPCQIAKETEYYKHRFGSIVANMDLDASAAQGSSAKSTANKPQ